MATRPPRQPLSTLLALCTLAAILGSSHAYSGGVAEQDANASVHAERDHAQAPPPSCAGGTPGADDRCGLGHDDDCCASLPVPGGTFNRLNDPRYPASVSSFHLDKYMVTVGRFRRYLEETGGPTQASPPPAGAGAHPKIPDSGWDAAWNTMLPATTAEMKRALVCDPYGWPTWTDAPAANEDKPIVCATWLELFAFCAWDGGRLPTQAEMNYAAAGGDEQRLYPWGSSPITSEDAAFCCQGEGTTSLPCEDAFPPWSLIHCTTDDLAPVGSFPRGAGRWGQLDLAGEAYKVTRDAADDDRPLVPCDDCSRLDNHAALRVAHGGSFVAAGYRQTTTYRAPYETDGRHYYVSAMCARDLPGP
ncbi:putative secreted protein [Sorangium cellulosum So ce56]|uniref:Secreted protein n=1 Tax=Sorangium cellulosum (strain So ce56) TaxID=448385 RepID=A9G4Y7_SORC5|nr:SUMF1/EgtB/PvdO family nonheme iron enzyme [Sorangium cellulosum]CAN98952.1 putative secreted protein [Sorangium cellulosum So ce56]